MEATANGPVWSHRQIAIVNWSSIASGIAGLALIIIAPVAAERLHTSAVYFFVPGATVVSIALLALVITSCCVRRPEERERL